MAMNAEQEAAYNAKYLRKNGDAWRFNPTRGEGWLLLQDYVAMLCRQREVVAMQIAFHVCNKAEVPPVLEVEFVSLTNQISGWVSREFSVFVRKSKR